MRAGPIIAAVVAVAMLGACTGRAGKGIAVIGGFIVVGSVVGLQIETTSEAQPIPASLGFLVLGLVVGLGGLLTMAIAPDEPPASEFEVVTSNAPRPAAGIPEPPPDRDAERARLIEHERRRTIAVDMARSAQAAASRGDCATVQVIAGRVQKLDREYYEADFVLTPAIKACLPVTPQETTRMR